MPCSPASPGKPLRTESRDPALAIVCLLPALLAAVTAREPFTIEESPGNLGHVFADPVLWLTGLILFLSDATPGRSS